MGVLGCCVVGCCVVGCWVVGCCVVGCCVSVVELLVDGADVFEFVDGFFAAFFLAFFSALRAGSVPPTSTPATAAGAATLIVSAFVPAPAVAVLPPPPELEMPNAAPKAATTAISPIAIVRGSMVLGLYFLALLGICSARPTFWKGAVGVNALTPPSLGDLVAGGLEAAQRSGD